ncbi:unnamed protein product [Urochloa decumbens]|uniref:DUF295 domain-containing protein n=1 Tax=Urochloa decumbens TaxID=240449 RepID=A0ABC9C5V8_9POAL
MGIVALPPSWEELPPDLLGLVLHRLPSLADRVRLRAVCRPWRVGAHPQRHKPLPPPLPWLALRDGTLVDLQGDPVRCGPILREGMGIFRYLAVDNLAFLVHDDGTCSLMNPLSGFTLPLTQLAPALRRALDESKVYRRSNILKTHSKVILSSPLDSTPDPFIAVLIMEEHGMIVSACNQLDAVRTFVPGRIDDIAFFQGKLYAITESEGLRALELDAGRLSGPKSSSGFHQCIAKDPKQWPVYRATASTVYFVLRYLVECSGKLLMVRRWMSFSCHNRLGDHDKTSWFEVLEADLATIPGQWINVDSLDGHAIFLDSECSKSVRASKCAGGVQEDCIYFMHRVFDNPSREYFGPCVNPLGDSGVYNMRDGKITQLLPEAVMSELRCKQQYLTWFFPAGA